MTARPTLPAPVIIEKFWANRQHQALIVALSTFEGQNLIDIRKHAMDKAGRLVPTPRGISLKVTRLPDLAKAIDKALKRAIELGLIDDGAGE